MQYPATTSQATNPVAAFLRTTNLVFAVYDTRRGQCEGEEHEKLLSFFPTIAPTHVRTSIVGLAQAVASFANTLSQDDSRFKSLVAEQFKWVMFHAEPHLWMLAVLRRSWAGPTCTDAAPRALLSSLHDVFVLLHGSMESLLLQDPTGFSLRRVLQPLLDEAGSRLLRAEGGAGRGPGGVTALLANPLAPHCPAALPLLTPSHAAFLAVQCLVQQLLVASFFGSRLVAGVLVLWGALPLASTLGPADTAALTTLAARALEPAARAAQKGRPAGAGTPMALAAGVGALAAASGGAASGETAYDTLLSPLQWRAGGGIHPAPAAAAPLGGPALSGASASSSSSTPSAAGGGGMGSSLLASFSAAGVASMLGSAAGMLGATPPLPVSSPATAGPPPLPMVGGGSSGASGVGSALPPFLSSFLRPRLRPSMYSPSPGGGPGGGAAALPVEGVLPLAHVWLRGSSEWVQLLPYHRGPLLVLALLHDGPPPGPDTLAALAAVLGRGAAPAAAALAAELPHPRELWHERGHRYCFTDATCHASRYSPLKKVFTLSAGALRHMALLRSKMDEWAAEGAARAAAADRQRRLTLGAAVAPEPEGKATAAREGQGREEEEEEARQAAGGAAKAAIGNGGAVAAPAAASAAVPGAGPFAASGDAELVVRTGRDALLVLRAAPGGRRLYAASDGGPELGLAAAVAPTDALCDVLFPGVFLPA